MCEPCNFLQTWKWILIYHLVDLAHLHWKLKWAYLIACCPWSFLLSVNFSHFQLLLRNHWANFNQTWQKTFLGEGNSSLFKWGALSFPRIDNNQIVCSISKDPFAWWLLNFIQRLPLEDWWSLMNSRWCGQSLRSKC